MSRIGLKPITLPKGVKYTMANGNVEVEGPKGKVSALVPQGISLSEKDGVLSVERENDSQKALHGLARALVFNAVEGVTNGWKKELDVVGIGYRVEMKGKSTVELQTRRKIRYRKITYGESIQKRRKPIQTKKKLYH